MALSIHYDFPHLGCAKCRIRSEEHDVTITAAFALSDALSSFMQTVLALAEGKETARVIFDEEPGAFFWIFQRTRENRVSVRVYNFFREPILGSFVAPTIPYEWNDVPDDIKKRCIVNAECSVPELVETTLNAMDFLLQTYGKKGYRAEWLYHFPTRYYNKLQVWKQLNKQESSSAASVQ